MAAHIWKRLHHSWICILTQCAYRRNFWLFLFFLEAPSSEEIQMCGSTPKNWRSLKQRLARKLEALFGQTSSVRLCFCQTKPHTRNWFGISFHFLEATKVLRLFKGLSITHLQSKTFFWNMFSADWLDMQTKSERPRLSASFSAFASSGRAPDTSGIAFQVVVWPL